MAGNVALFTESGITAEGLPRGLPDQSGIQREAEPLIIKVIEPVILDAAGSAGRYGGALRVAERDLRSISQADRGYGWVGFKQTGGVRQEIVPTIGPVVLAMENKRGFDGGIQGVDGGVVAKMMTRADKTSFRAQ